MHKPTASPAMKKSAFFIGCASVTLIQRNGQLALSDRSHTLPQRCSLDAWTLAQTMLTRQSVEQLSIDSSWCKQPSAQASEFGFVSPSEDSQNYEARLCGPEILPLHGRSQ